MNEANEANDLTHFSDAGRARMVDVSAKADTQRVAIASGVLRLQPAPGLLQGARAHGRARGGLQGRGGGQLPLRIKQQYRRCCLRQFGSGGAGQQVQQCGKRFLHGGGGPERAIALPGPVPLPDHSCRCVTAADLMVTIGFNKDVAWSHTVSTGKRFTLYELALDPADPTAYLVDGQSEKMTARKISAQVPGADGKLRAQEHTVWSTRWGPLVVLPRAGLTWNAKTAYALRDANAGNARMMDAALAFARATTVNDLHQAHASLGLPWVNTLAADRGGRAMYADVSVVPDVDAAQLARCAPGQPAAALRQAAGLVVLNGSRADCAWHRDSTSPVPGLIPIGRMPVAVRSDWVHNSNDSFVYTHPDQKFEGISPLVGDDSLTRPRTRAGLAEIPEMLGRGKVTLQAIQGQLFENRNFMASVVLPDLLQACAQAPSAESRDGCAALRGWSRRNDVDARGAHVFREFWRTARTIPGVHRVPFDRQQPVATPAGLKMNDPAIAARVWGALDGAVKTIRSSGIALDATLGGVQRPAITDEPIALHGGEEFEGVLNNLGRQEPAPITQAGLRIDYGTSYVQTVTFDARGPVAQAILTYGQSTNPASPHANDQMRAFSAKQWHTLPFHREDVVKARVGQPLRLVRP